MGEIKNMKKFGFGTMRLPLLNEEDKSSIDYEQVCRMVDTFLERGFTYFDTAYPYHEGFSEVAVKKCLVDRYPRESYVLADKMPIIRVTGSEDYEKYFNEQLEKTGAGYFDYYLLHNIGVERYPKVKNFGGFKFLAKKKEEGIIKKLGFSFHDNAELLETVLSENPEIDFVQLQINYLDWESAVIQSGKCYKVCEKYNKPVVVMEPIKGGTLAVLPEEAQKLIDEYNAKGHKLTAPELAIRFAASLDNVFMVLSGMSNEAQLNENTEFMSDFKPLSEEEKELVEKITAILNRTIAIPCTSCKYCLEVCPISVNIPAYFGLYNMHSTTGKKTNMYYERAIENHAKASECLKCGACEKNCPQHISIREWLDKFVQLYEA